MRQPFLSRYAIEAKAFVKFLPHAANVELSKHGLEERVHRSSVVGATLFTHFAPLSSCGIIERMQRKSILGLGLVPACYRPVSAVNPTLEFDQYAHETWTILDHQHRRSRSQ